MEREKVNLSFAEYLRKIQMITPAVESFTSVQRKSFTIKEESEVLDKTNSLSENLYSHMTYLRHHGFPSPLLDWTLSPYIAAFFAFNEAHDDKVAFFTYCFKVY